MLALPSLRAACGAALLVLLGAACARKAAPQADPAAAKARADAIRLAAPNPGAVGKCTDEDLATGLPMTQNTLLRLAGATVDDDAEHAPWVQPPELDGAPARVLLDGAASDTARREAAAAFLAAPGYLVYRIDNVDAPLALGVKELKRGTVSARIIRHHPNGDAACVRVFLWQNSKERSEWAIKKSDRALVDPEVSAALQTDLKEQLLLKVPRPRP